MTRSPAVPDRTKKKKPVPWLPSSRSERHVLQCRCQPTPTQPIILCIWGRGILLLKPCKDHVLKTRCRHFWCVSFRLETSPFWFVFLIPNVGRSVGRFLFYFIFFLERGGFGFVLFSPCASRRFRGCVGGTNMDSDAERDHPSRHANYFVRGARESKAARSDHSFS